MCVDATPATASILNAKWLNFRREGTTLFDIGRWLAIDQKSKRRRPAFAFGPGRQPVLAVVVEALVATHVADPGIRNHDTPEPPGPSVGTVRVVIPSACEHAPTKSTLIIVHHMPPMSTTEAARRLDVKVQTIYAYVSRGILESYVGPDGTSSRFDRPAIEALALRGRPRQSTRAASLNLLIETGITHPS